MSIASNVQAIFEMFLADKCMTAAFKENIVSAGKEYTAFMKRCVATPKAIIIQAFTWSDTPEGCRVWAKLDDQWQEVIGKHLSGEYVVFPKGSEVVLKKDITDADIAKGLFSSGYAGSSSDKGRYADVRSNGAVVESCRVDGGDKGMGLSLKGLPYMWPNGIFELKDTNLLGKGDRVFLKPEITSADLMADHLYVISHADAEDEALFDTLKTTGLLVRSVDPNVYGLRTRAQNYNGTPSCELVGSVLTFPQAILTTEKPEVGHDYTSGDTFVVGDEVRLRKGLSIEEISKHVFASGEQLDEALVARYRTGATITGQRFGKWSYATDINSIDFDGDWFTYPAFLFEKIAVPEPIVVPEQGKVYRIKEILPRSSRYYRRGDLEGSLFIPSGGMNFSHMDGGACSITGDVVGVPDVNHIYGALVEEADAKDLFPEMPHVDATAAELLAFYTFLAERGDYDDFCSEVEDMDLPSYWRTRSGRFIVDCALDFSQCDDDAWAERLDYAWRAQHYKLGL